MGNNMGEMVEIQASQRLGNLPGRGVGLGVGCIESKVFLPWVTEHKVSKCMEVDYQVYQEDSYAFAKSHLFIGLEQSTMLLESLIQSRQTFLGPSWIRYLASSQVGTLSEGT